MRSEFEISGGEVWVCVHLKARAIAVIPGRRRMHLNLTGKFELGDAAQILAQDFFLDIELMVVVGMLIVTSATAGEMRTGRRYAVRGGLHDCGSMSAREAGLFFGDRGVDFFAGENKGNEDGFAAAAVLIGGLRGGKAGESVAAVDELFNG